MCLVSPARVMALDGAVATLDSGGRRREASILLAPDLRVGDWVVVAGGAVLRQLDESAASAMQAAVSIASGSAPNHEGSSRGARDE